MSGTTAATGTTKFFSADDNIPDLLAACARIRPDHVYCKTEGVEVTYAQLAARVEYAAGILYARGVRPGMHVVGMLAHHFDHIITFFALMRLAAVLVPVNTALKGPSLAHIFEHSHPDFLIIDEAFGEQVAEVIALRGAAMSTVWRRPSPDGGQMQQALYSGDAPPAPEVEQSDEMVREILYTSGTTGLAKGVVMPDRMVRATALGSIWIGKIEPGSVLHFWESIHHVMGTEVIVLALMVPVTLVMVPRFSASRLWQEARGNGCSHIHFVGGVLQLLLKQPPSPLDKSHGVKIAWGGGCPAEIWRQFEERFGVRVHEGYGMTETSSFSTINLDGKVGSIGREVAYFEVQLVDDHGQPTPLGEPGELRVRGREPGVLVSRYYNNLEATQAALRDGWLYTGDLATQDGEGYYYFLGRKKDSLRRRGENVSAWEVERVFNDHPDVEECALIGVKNEFADQDLKLFVKLRNPGVTESQLADWAKPRMAAFQVPRFIKLVEGFQKTASERIQKQYLSTALDDCWDKGQ